MLRRCACVAAIFTLACLPFPATASGDFACDTSWRLSHANLTGCDDMAMLGPGNDTRTNLIWLLADRRGGMPQPGKGADPLPALFDWRTLAAWLAPIPGDGDSDYSSGEGSRCRSNDSGAAAFVAAVKAEKMPADESASLIAARGALKPDCAKPGGLMGYEAALKSPAGRAFATYLSGTISFYDGDYDNAAKDFAGLRDAPNPWVRETARYMAARVEVNRIQANLFDEYGNLKDLKAVDAKAVAAADAGLHAYLKDYPKGAYAASAQGLLRRVYWFGGERDQLAAQYVAMFAGTGGGQAAVDLAEELDTKLFPDLTIGDTTDPTLLAVLDLRRMRTADDEISAGCCTDTISRADLDGQRGAFAKNPALFDYLVAAHTFYVAKQPAQVLAMIPDAAKQANFSPLQFSRQMLRGMALEAVKDRNARGFWMEMLPGAKSAPQHSALELALAMHDERAGQLARVFAPDSPVDDAAIREILLLNTADPGLLRQQAKGATAKHERDVALFTLLYKELSRGQYRGFLGDLPLVPAGASTEANFYDFVGQEAVPVGLFAKPNSLGDYDCPALKATAATLAANPRDNRARLCLADFFRANGFDGISLNAATDPKAVRPADPDLGATPTLFPGPLYSRLEVYKTIIADPAATGDDKAYALYRAINCYAPSGNNSCDGKDVDKATRKAWFARLKADYPKSRWASGLRYYW